MHKLDDYNYILPPELVAQTPADPAESCKFLVVDKHNWNASDHIFWDITDLIDPETVIVFNNSKVVKARIPIPFKNKEWEIFYLWKHDQNTFEALVRPGKNFTVWQTIFLDEIQFEVIDITRNGRLLRSNIGIDKILEKYGQMPLPPYIWYDKSKEDSYQPFFAKKNWSVAAPTASLHFTPALLQSLLQKWVEFAYTTLHVGLWTFKTVDTQQIESYDIHSEQIEVPRDIFTTLAQAKAEKKKILAVWTTVTRTLESLPHLRDHLQDKQKQRYDETTKSYRDNLVQHLDWNKVVQELLLHDDSISFQTKLYLYPGKKTFVIDELITNFHLPKSSLLMLVASILGYDLMRQVYDHAIQYKYRFYSFWDAMRIR